MISGKSRFRSNEIKKKIPEALLVFVTPPTVEELERRLTGRGTQRLHRRPEQTQRAGEEAKEYGSV